MSSFLHLNTSSSLLVRAVHQRPRSHGKPAVFAAFAYDQAGPLNVALGLVRPIGCPRAAGLFIHPRQPTCSSCCALDQGQTGPVDTE
ncbi:hypothetical protein FJTKL_01867 [Diaporthe vaccinii]|uniref:Uncharacterized protein n=1 Tax=Diaporthe vaccinii TaxID=105482 RepID=A0ABR4F4L4_9PEZI